MTTANQACWDTRPTSPPTAEQPNSAPMDAAVKMRKRPRGSLVRNAINDHAPNPIATITTTRCMRSTIIDRSLRCHCHPEPGPRLAHLLTGFSTLDSSDRGLSNRFAVRPGHIQKKFVELPKAAP